MLSPELSWNYISQNSLYYMVWFSLSYVNLCEIWKVAVFILQSEGVLVFSGCYNKIPLTRHLINNRNLFLIVLEGEVKEQYASMVWPGAYYRLKTSCCVFTWWKGLGSSVSLSFKRPIYSFIRGLIPFMRAAASWPKHLPKAPPLNTIALIIRISTYTF